MQSIEWWILGAPAFLLAITLHEAAHAFAALRFGDPTARDRGRLTLNPLKHLDPVGTLVFFMVGFGWAKPVPVDPRNLKNPIKDDLWIATAGPGANILLAVLSAMLMRLWYLTGGLGLGPLAEGMWSFLVISLNVNLVLAIFNMIPVQPLDGSAVLLGLLPERYVPVVQRLNAIGPAVIFGLVMLGLVTGHSILGAILWPPVRFLGTLLTGGLV